MPAATTRLKRASSGATRRAKNASATEIDVGWIRDLARPYLKGYRPVAAKENSLRGFWLLHPQSSRVKKPLGSTPAIGFFVGYLVDEKDFSFLRPAPPECLVFAFVTPVVKSLHRRLVADSASLVRKTASYIRWLTHRPPHFVFLENESVALVRHQSMRDWPLEKHAHYSRNFFIETLAWLVRSALVRRLLAEPVGPRPNSSLKSP
jgi:hypothetical protein